MRNPIEDRWSLDSIKWVKHVNRDKNDEEADRDIWKRKWRTSKRPKVVVVR